MLVRLVGMARMVVVVGAVFPGVVVVVGVRVGPVGMFVLVLVQVFVGVAVGVFMAVGFAPMGMFMAVRVAMLVPVQMFVLVFAFHGLPPFRRLRDPKKRRGQEFSIKTIRTSRHPDLPRPAFVKIQSNDSIPRGQGASPRVPVRPIPANIPPIGRRPKFLDRPIPPW
jgi:hypothetical protein